MTALLPGAALFPSGSLYPDGGGTLIPTAVPTQTITDEGGVASPAGACDDINGNVVLNNNGVSMWLEFRNTSGSPQTVAITLPYPIKGQPVPDIVVTLAAGAVQRRGPFDIRFYSAAVTFKAS